MDLDDALTLLGQLEDELDRRSKDIVGWREYYDGEHNLRFVTAEYETQFGDVYAGFRDNWVAPTVGAVPEKLQFVGLRLARDEGDTAERAADTEFARIWDANEGHAESSLAWVESSLAKRAYALVWPDPDDDKTPTITFETADEAVVSYDPGTRRGRAGLKRWQQDEHWIYATLYVRAGLFDENDPLLVWKFRKRSTTTTTATASTGLWVPPSSVAWLRSSARGWEQREVRDETWPLEGPDGYTGLPLIELPNRPQLKNREPVSEAEVVIPMQDAVNAFWAYLFTGADFAALPQRVVLNAAFKREAILDANGQPTGAFKDIADFLRPVMRGRIQAFEGTAAQKAEIDSWEAADLSVFPKIIDFAVGHIAAQSRTPVDRYISNSTLANVNAEGLKALNESHVAKCGETSVYLSGGLRRIAVTAYEMIGDRKRAEAARRATVMWEDFEARSDAALGDKLLKWKQVGFSFEFLAGHVIKDPVELRREVERHDAEIAAAAAAFDFAPKPPTEDTAPVDDQS